MGRRRIEYTKYNFTFCESILYVGLCIGVFLLIAYIFYNNLLVAIVFLPLTFMLLRYIKKHLIERRTEQLTLQFKEVLTAMSTAVSAGYSVENSIVEAYKEVKILYGEGCYIVNELEIMISDMKVNRPFYELLLEFAYRTSVPEIITFAEVYSIVRRSGGNIRQLIHVTENNIAQRLNTERDIKTLVNAKKYESRIMNIVPVITIIYVRMTSPEFKEILYGNIVGVLIMTMSLILCVVAFLVSEKILSIEM